MGRLIDSDSFEAGIKILFNENNPILHIVINKLHDQPTVEAIPKANYENRLKADMVAMLTEIQLEIEEYQKIHDSYCDHYIKDDVWEHHTREHYDSSSGKAIACDYCLKTIQKKIDKLKEK